MKEKNMALESASEPSGNKSRCWWKSKMVAMWTFLAASLKKRNHAVPSREADRCLVRHQRSRLPQQMQRPSARHYTLPPSNPSPGGSGNPVEAEAGRVLEDWRAPSKAHKNSETKAACTGLPGFVPGPLRVHDGFSLALLCLA